MIGWLFGYRRYDPPQHSPATKVDAKPSTETERHMVLRDKRLVEISANEAKGLEFVGWHIENRVCIYRYRDR